jgi:hypothetical protein
MHPQYAYAVCIVQVWHPSHLTDWPSISGNRVSATAPNGALRRIRRDPVDGGNPLSEDGKER